jgi:hypothetical protein
LSSIRAVAEDAQVGRSTVHKFISAGTMPHPRVRRLLALWYLRRLSGLDEFELIRPYVSALKTLLAHVPEPLHRHVTLALLDEIKRGCEEMGQETPGWVQVLRTRWSRIGEASQTLAGKAG